MRGYPIGIALFWETYEDLQYRRFLYHYEPDSKFMFQENPNGNRLKVVLDGQQRLQSLFLALYGRYGNEHLYFDVLSGEEADDFKEERYGFDFMTSADANQQNKVAKNDRSHPTLSANHTGETLEQQYFVKVIDLKNHSTKSRVAFRKDLVQKLKLTSDEELRVETNLARFDEVFFKDENLLKILVIDHNLPRESTERKSESDVLEIFVRINRQGTALSRSDLIFSMLKLSWKESAEALPSFVAEINEANSLDLDTDFVIRCLYAVSDLGTKFDVDVLRKKSNVEKVKANFNRCCQAIQSTVDFVLKECWCSNSRLLGGQNTLVPLVYYLFHVNKIQVPTESIVPARKSLYLFAFTRVFSRYGDSRLAKFCREELKPLADRGVQQFPFKAALSWASYWGNIHEYGLDFLQQNPALALHVIQKQTGAKSHYSPNKPEMDHIFPRSILRQKGHDEKLVNHLANFWLLAKGHNQNKSNKHPKDYFKKVNNKELKRALIDRELLDYRRYRTFLQERGSRILQSVKKTVGLSERDWELLQ